MVRGKQVTSYPQEELEVSADTPLIAPRGAQGKHQQIQTQLASGNQVLSVALTLAWIRALNKHAVALVVR